jgi:hypothetical protein
MATAGNTVRLSVEFKTFAGAYADPSSITFKAYNKNNGQIGSTVTLTVSNKTDTGKYQYDYTIPTGYSSIKVEFAGLLEGTALLATSTIDIN